MLYNYMCYTTYISNTFKKYILFMLYIIYIQLLSFNAFIYVIYKTNAQISRFYVIYLLYIYFHFVASSKFQVSGSVKKAFNLLQTLYILYNIIIYCKSSQSQHFPIFFACCINLEQFDDYIYVIYHNRWYVHSIS